MRVEPFATTAPDMLFARHAVLFVSAAAIPALVKLLPSMTVSLDTGTRPKGHHYGEFHKKPHLSNVRKLAADCVNSPDTQSCLDDAFRLRRAGNKQPGG